MDISQFVYEPHIAPKLEIFVENWLEQRRLKRRQLARTVSFGDEGDLPAASRGTTQVEMDTISAPLRVTSIDAGLTESTLRHRSNATSGHDALVLESASRSCTHAVISYLHIYYSPMYSFHSVL